MKARGCNGASHKNRRVSSAEYTRCYNFTNYFKRSYPTCSRGKHVHHHVNFHTTVYIEASIPLQHYAGHVSLNAEPFACQTRSQSHGHLSD